MGEESQLRRAHVEAEAAIEAMAIVAGIVCRYKILP
jgi:hypothetical protein